MLAEHRYQAVQRLGRRLRVLHQRETDVTPAGIAAVRLLSSEIAARNDAYAALLVQAQRHVLLGAERRNIEPDTEATVGPLVTVTVAEDLVGKIELEAV